MLELHVWIRLLKSFGGTRCSVLPYDMTAGYSGGPGWISQGKWQETGAGNKSVPENADDRETLFQKTHKKCNYNNYIYHLLSYLKLSSKQIAVLNEESSKHIKSFSLSMDLGLLKPMVFSSHL